MTPSTLIRVTGDMLAKLQEIRDLHRCSYTQAIKYYGDDQLTVGAIIQAKMKKIYELVEREYSISDLFNTEIHIKLQELRLSEALLKKAIATERDRIADKIEEDELVSRGHMSSEREKLNELDQHLLELGEAEAKQNDLYQTNDNQKKKHN